MWVERLKGARQGHFDSLRALAPGSANAIPFYLKTAGHAADTDVRCFAGQATARADAALRSRSAYTLKIGWLRQSL